MTKALLDLLDVDLTATPACEEATGCDRPATCVASYGCGCMVLFCSEHAEEKLRAWGGLSMPFCVRCGWCHLVIEVWRLADLVKVVPL